MGRPSYQPTPEHKKMVSTLCGFGVPVDDICKVIENPSTGRPIDKKTLYKYYKNELDTGHIKANSKVAGNLFNIATGTTPQAVTAAIFWLKCQAGWKDKGKDAGPEDDVDMPDEIIIRAANGKEKN